MNGKSMGGGNNSVTLDTEQEITGKKTFTQAVTLPDNEAESNDSTAATTKFVSNKVLGVSADVEGVSIKLDSKADSDSVYQKEETYSKTEADEKFLTKHQDISSLTSGLVTVQQNVETLTTGLASKADTATVNSQISEVQTALDKTVKSEGAKSSVTSVYPSLTGVTGVYVVKTKAEGEAYSREHPTVLVIVTDE